MSVGLSVGLSADTFDFLCILRYFGVCWVMLGHVGVYWGILGYIGVYWGIFNILIKIL